MYKWFLPTLSEILTLSEQTQGEPFEGGTAPSVSVGVSHHQLNSQRSNKSSRALMAQRRAKVEREWCGAIAALSTLLQQQGKVDSLDVSESMASWTHGLVLSGPLPVLDHSTLSSLASWTFTNEPQGALTWMPFQLLPAASADQVAPRACGASTLPLIPGDPLATEQFCLVLTADFSLVMVLGEDSWGEAVFLFSFEPEIVQQVWRSLRSRALLTSRHQVGQLDALVKQFSPVSPDYRTVTQFTRLMLHHLPDAVNLSAGAAQSQSIVGTVRAETDQIEPTHSLKRELLPKQHSHRDAAKAKTLISANGISSPGGSSDGLSHRFNDHELDPDLTLEKLAGAKDSPDAELLQAIAHEVRTPLSTIRTLTRLLLKRKDLHADVMKRLEVIDRECTKQIDRFSLIFRAVELETTAAKSSLGRFTPISLTEVFEENIPRWQKQVSQRSLTLDFNLPQTLPMVISDPTMLDQVLTGLMERFTHSLPLGSHIQVQVMPAGNQLKLQLHSQPQPFEEWEDISRVKDARPCPAKPTLKSLGRLLMFQPETGNLSLNLAVTKNLFQALGGKLIVRQRPQQGEVITIFLPLAKKSYE